MRKQLYILQLLLSLFVSCQQQPSFAQTIFNPKQGGTGVNNGTKTITLGGNLVTSGAFGLTLTVTGTTNVTLPTSGTLVNTAVATLSSLTSVGTIGTGVWQGTKVAESYGGTNQSTYTTGDLLYSSASNTLSKLAIGSSAQVLTVVSGVPAWAAAGGGGPTIYSPTIANCSNTTTLTDILTLTIAANTWADGEWIELRVPCVKHKNQSGGAVTFDNYVLVGGSSKHTINGASIANAVGEGRTSFSIWFCRVGTSVYMQVGLDNGGSLNYHANAPMSFRFFNGGYDFTTDQFSSNDGNEFTSVTFSSSLVLKLQAQFGTANAATYYNIASAKAIKY